MTIKIEASKRLLLSAGRLTGQGAGAIFYCPATGNFLLVKRSHTGDAPNTWCGLGGGVDPEDDCYETTVRRESNEEAGFDGECELHHLNSDRQIDPSNQECPDFTFHNYLSVVDSEFEPKLNHEHTDYMWSPRESWPDNMHPGLMRSLSTPKATRVMDLYCRG